MGHRDLKLRHACIIAKFNQCTTISSHLGWPAICRGGFCPSCSNERRLCNPRRCYAPKAWTGLQERPVLLIFATSFDVAQRRGALRGRTAKPRVEPRSRMGDHAYDELRDNGRFVAPTQSRRRLSHWLEGKKHMYWDIVEVVPKADSSLFVQFKDGLEGLASASASGALDWRARTCEGRKLLQVFVDTGARPAPTPLKEANTYLIKRNLQVAIAPWSGVGALAAVPLDYSPPRAAARNSPTDRATTRER
jgi:hypothetical protein